jgi:hypothetical protein
LIRPPRFIDHQNCKNMFGRILRRQIRASASPGFPPRHKSFEMDVVHLAAEYVSRRLLVAEAKFTPVLEPLDHDFTAGQEAPARPA